MELLQWVMSQLIFCVSLCVSHVLLGCLFTVLLQGRVPALACVVCILHRTPLVGHVSVHCLCVSLCMYMYVYYLAVFLLFYFRVVSQLDGWLWSHWRKERIHPKVMCKCLYMYVPQF